MKTIKEQAQEYACDGIVPNSQECKSCYNIHGKCNYDAFLAGARAATRWIPVEEEPPCFDQKIICISNRGVIEHAFGGKVIGDNRIIQEERKDPNYFHWEYWLPIPPEPEK